MNSRKIMSIILRVVGIAVFIFSAAVDRIGIGRYPGFGTYQIAGIVLGVILVIAGLVSLSKKQAQTPQ
jgi:hypothetical protein